MGGLTHSMSYLTFVGYLNFSFAVHVTVLS